MELTWFKEIAVDQLVDLVLLHYDGHFFFTLSEGFVMKNE